MTTSLVYLSFIFVIHFVVSSSTFDHDDVEDVVSYLVANSERGALLRRRRLDIDTLTEHRLILLLRRAAIRVPTLRVTLVPQMIHGHESTTLCALAELLF